MLTRSLRILSGSSYGFQSTCADDLQTSVQETVVDATTSRRFWSSTSSSTLLDFGSAFFRYLVNEATSPAFGGGYAAVRRESVQGDLAAAFLGRWQNDQGEPLDHQLFVVCKTEAGSLEIDNLIISGLFTAPVSALRPASATAAVRRTLLDAARNRVEVEMSASVSRFRHPNDLVLLAVAERGSENPDGEDPIANTSEAVAREDRGSPS
jgi:hypothetical protein